VGPGLQPVAGHLTTARLARHALILTIPRWGGVEMPKSKAQHVQIEPLASVDTGGAFPRLRLTAEQWNEISKVSGIPNSTKEARDSTEIALGLFRQFQATDSCRMRAAKLRQRFHALAEEARSFYKRLSDLVGNRDAYTALVGDLSSAEPQLRMLGGLPKWFLIAASRVKDEKRGPKSGHVYWLVGNLDGIRTQFTGKKITRSYKDSDSVEYIKCVCEIADPSIESGTIDRNPR
jgi:hypothetical protein